jgi:hypothetical protein
MALAEYGNALNIDTDGSGRPILVDPDSGDTIAIYDRASSAWQVTTIEATTGDFGSVKTEDLDSGGDFGDGVKTTLLDGVNNSERGAMLGTQPTVDVSTSAKRIYNIENSRSGALIAVVGYESSATQIMFFDVITALRGGGGGVSVINSDGAGGPNGRSYSMSGANVELAMSADTYAVTTTALDLVLPT